jgi:glycosyltransferase involved in cell wall biosynthesis
MKIALDATFFFGPYDGGKEQVLYNLLRGFREIGQAQNLIIFCYNSRQKQLRELAPEATFHVLEDPRKEKKKFWEISSCNAKRYYFENVLLPKLLKQYKPDVLFFSKFDTSRNKLSLPTVVLPHDIQNQTHPERFKLKLHYLMKIILHYDFSLRDRIVAISDFDRQEMLGLYPEYEQKIVRIYNPVYFPMEFYDGPRKDIVALNVVYPHKNVGTLIKAFAKIKDRIADNLILIGGRCGYVEELMQLAKDMHLEDRVQFTGYLPDAEMYQRLTQARLYVNPSLFEGFGLTAVEAMLAGTPTLVAKVTAMPEITQGLAGYYEPPEAVDVLAAKMQEMLENPPAQEHLREISKQMREAYSCKKCAEEYMKLFESLVK